MFLLVGEGDMIDGKEIIKEERKQIKELVSEIDFKAENAKYIKQGDYGVAYGGGNQFVLGTTQLSSCVAVAFYCEELKLAALTHVDFRTDIRSLSQVLNFFPSKEIDCYLYGGSSLHKDMRKELLTFLKEKPNINLKAKTFNKLDFTDLLMGVLNEDSDFISKNICSLAINARNGKIYTEVTEKNFDNGLIDLNSLYSELLPRISSHENKGTLPLTQAFCSLPSEPILNEELQLKDEEPQLKILKEVLEIFLSLYETSNNSLLPLFLSKDQSFFSQCRKNIHMMDSTDSEKIKETAKKMLTLSSESETMIHDETSVKLLKAIASWDESELNSVKEELKEMKNILISDVCTIL